MIYIYFLINQKYLYLKATEFRRTIVSNVGKGTENVKDFIFKGSSQIIILRGYSTNG